jgi:hypothetical protein
MSPAQSTCGTRCIWITVWLSAVTADYVLGTHAADDHLVHQEDDERFFAGVDLTRSEALLVISLDSTMTSEVRVLAADDPTGEFRVVEPRRQGVEYSIDHSGDYLYIVHNDDAADFELVRAPVETPGREHWAPVLAHEPDTRVAGVSAFSDHLVVSLRRAGSTGLHVVPLRDDGAQPGHDIVFTEEVRTVTAGSNPEFTSDTFRLGYTSLGTPSSVYDYHIPTRELRLRKRQAVLGRIVDSVNARQPMPLAFNREWDSPTHPERIYFRSDHYSYAKKGIPVVFLTTGLHGDYHKVSDEPSKIDYAKLSRVATLMHDVVVAVGNRRTRPR